MKSVLATQKTILHQSLETDLDYGSYICRVKVCYAGFRSVGLSSSASTIWICRIQISRILNWPNPKKTVSTISLPQGEENIAVSLEYGSFWANQYLSSHKKLMEPHWFNSTNLKFGESKRTEKNTAPSYRNSATHCFRRDLKFRGSISFFCRKIKIIS